MESNYTIGHGTTINDLIKQKKAVVFHHSLSGQKFDSGKLEMGEFFKQFPKALEGLCTVAQYGKIKYSEGNGNVNFKEVPDSLKRYTDATVRHLMAYLKDEFIDSESLCPHLYHLLWNICALIEIDNIATDFDIDEALDKNRIKALTKSK